MLNRSEIADAVNVTQEKCEVYKKILLDLFEKHPMPPVGSDLHTNEYIRQCARWRDEGLARLKKGFPKEALWWISGSGVPDDDMLIAYNLLFL
jgi:hypothetical protein